MPTEPALRTELAWKSAALELGLSYTPPALFKPRVMIGEIEGFAVKADVFSAGSGGATFTRIVVKGGPGPQLHLDLIINEENTGTALKKLVVGEDIQTGDADFDRAVNIHGPELEVLALMNREARRALSGLMALGGSVRRGEVFFQVSGVLSDDRKLVDMVRSMVAAARALPALSPDEVSPRLAGIASTDPDVAVRLRALHALERGFAGSDQARRAGERALASADLEERFAGARLVGLDRGGSARRPPRPRVLRDPRSATRVSSARVGLPGLGRRVRIRAGVRGGASLPRRSPPGGSGGGTSRGRPDARPVAL